jgi:hypothetical protein
VVLYIYVICRAPLTSATLHKYMPYSVATSLLGNFLSSMKDTKGKKIYIYISFKQSVRQLLGTQPSPSETGHKMVRIEPKVEILKFILFPHLATDYYSPPVYLWMGRFFEYVQELYPEYLRRYHHMQLEFCLQLILFSLSQFIAVRSHILDIKWH